MADIVTEVAKGSISSFGHSHEGGCYVASVDSLTGTADLAVECGFHPSRVEIYGDNGGTGDWKREWINGMGSKNYTLIGAAGSLFVAGALVQLDNYDEATEQKSGPKGFTLLNGSLTGASGGGHIIAYR